MVKDAHPLDSKEDTLMRSLQNFQRYLVFLLTVNSSIKRAINKMVHIAYGASYSKQSRAKPFQPLLK